MNYSEIRRLSLKSFIGFLVLTALVGIVFVVSGEFGKLQIKILATCLAISAASICSMACAAFIEKRKHRALGLAGITLCIASALLAIFGMWPEIKDEEYWKATITLGVSAVALAHAFLLSLPHLDRRHTWVQMITSGSIGILALQIVIAAWAEIKGETYFRLLAVVAIVVGLETLVIPILMRFRQGNGQPPKRLVLRSVEGDLYEDASGKRYHVADAEGEK